MRETYKIVIACFIGGIICGSVAFAVAPLLWWIGLLSGFAGGYIAYEFRGVLRAIPKAWSATKKILETISETGKGIHSDIKEYFSKERPLFFLPLLGIVLSAPLFINLSFRTSLSASILENLIVLAFFCSVFGALSFLLFYALLLEIGDVGLRSKKLYCKDFYANFRAIDTEKTEGVPSTYKSLLYWNIVGIPIIIKFFIWDFWKSIFIVIYTITKFFTQFFWTLFKLIHSQKRVLCGIDGTLGGAIAFLYGSPFATSLNAQIFVILCGGLLGAFFGIINYEIVSKKLLKLHLQNGV